jgi:hypothetical protein
MATTFLQQVGYEEITRLLYVFQDFPFAYKLKVLLACKIDEFIELCNKDNTCYTLKGYGSFFHAQQIASPLSRLIWDFTDFDIKVLINNKVNTPCGLGTTIEYQRIIEEVKSKFYNWILGYTRTLFGDTGYQTHTCIDKNIGEWRTIKYSIVNVHIVDFTFIVDTATTQIEKTLLEELKGIFSIDTWFSKKKDNRMIIVKYAMDNKLTIDEPTENILDHPIFLDRDWVIIVVGWIIQNEEAEKKKIKDDYELEITKVRKEKDEQIKKLEQEKLDQLTQVEGVKNSSKEEELLKIIDNLRKEKEEMQKEKEQLKKEKEEIERLKNNREQDLINKITKLEEKTCHIEVEKLNKQLQELKAEKEATDRINGHLQSKCINLSTHNQQINLAIERKNHKIKEHVAYIKDTELIMSRIQETNKSYEIKLKENEDIILNLRKVNEHLKQTVFGHSQHLTNKDTKIKQQDEKIKKQEENINNLTKTKEELQRCIRRNEITLCNQRNQTEKLERANKKMTEELQSKETIKTKEVEMEVLKSQLQQEKQELLEKQKTMTENKEFIENQYGEMKEVQDKMNKEFKKISNKYDEMKRCYEKSEREMKKTKQKNEDTRKKYEEDHQELIRAKLEMKTLHAHNKRLKDITVVVHNVAMEFYHEMETYYAIRMYKLVNVLTEEPLWIDNMKYTETSTNEKKGKLMLEDMMNEIGKAMKSYMEGGRKVWHEKIKELYNIKESDAKELGDPEKLDNIIINDTIQHIHSVVNVFWANMKQCYVGYVRYMDAEFTEKHPIKTRTELKQKLDGKIPMQLFAPIMFVQR